MDFDIDDFDRAYEESDIEKDETETCDRCRGCGCNFCLMLQY